MRVFRFLSVTAAVWLLASAAAQPGSGASRSVTYGVSEVEGSGVSGVVFIGEYGASTAVVIALRGTPQGGDHPAHFHAGDCGSNGGIVVPLSNVSGDTGLSVTLTDAPYDEVVNGELYLNVHLSPDQLEVIVACGEVGAGAGVFAGQLPGAAATQTTPVVPQEFGQLQTASYGLFAVEGSGVSGHLQLSEQMGGGTQFVLTLLGIEPGQVYPAALYRGDCGPDRELVLELEPVGGGSVENDPFVSLGSADIPFAELAEGNYFAYVFAPGGGVDRPETFGLDAVALACGEVGAGANR